MGNGGRVSVPVGHDRCGIRAARPEVPGGPVPAQPVLHPHRAGVHHFLEMTIRNTTRMALHLGLAMGLGMGIALDSVAGEPAGATAAIAGGRRIDYVRSIASERDVNPSRSFWNKLVDVVAGAPKYRQVVRPYGIT